eukprot:7619693-Pyramimonas_sp.AAC.3
MARRVYGSALILLAGVDDGQGTRRPTEAFAPLCVALDKKRARVDTKGRYGAREKSARESSTPLRA